MNSSAALAEHAMNNTPDVTTNIGPVIGDDRIAGLDVLRGVAVLCILVMNIYAFAMPFIAYGNPLVMGGTEAHNLGTWFFTHILFDQKFLSIFAMLFGAGLILTTGRAEDRGRQVRPDLLSTANLVAGARRCSWLPDLVWRHPVYVCCDRNARLSP